MWRLLPTSRLFSVGERGRRIVNTGSWSLVAKAAAAANLFLCVPFVLSALGQVEFGAWATLVSLVIFAGFLDFGFGNGTMNLVAAAQGRGHVEEIAAIVSEGRRTLSWVALALAALVATAMPWVPWYRLLGLPATSAESARWAAAAVLFAIVLAVPLNLANRVQLGLGRGERAFRWQAVGQLLTLGLVIALAHARLSLPVLTAAAVFTPLLGSLANSISLLHEPGMARTTPRRPDLARAIRREGALFFVLQLAAAMAFSADLPLISALRGPADAGTYSIVQRLFSMIPLALSLVWAPLWPTYRHALASGHHDWVTRTLRRSVVAAVCFAACTGTLIAVGFDLITSMWVRHALVVGSTLLAGFAIWVALEAGGTALSTFLNAASIMRYQIIVATFFALICISGKALVLQHNGVEWMPWVTLVSYFFCFIIPTTISLPRLIDGALRRKYS